MATIDIKFYLSRGSETDDDCNEFDVDGCLDSAIDDYKDDLLSDLNDNEDGEGDWGVDEWVVTEFDGDFADPVDFADMNEYGAYVETCEEHGEGYVLRFADIGEFNFCDEYNGCWASIEEFAQDMIEGCYDIPDHLQHYIDWEKYASDIMMDYSQYDGDEGIHIFRDC